MRKILFLLLLIALPLQAQSDLLKMEKKRFVGGSATNLGTNNTTKYMSKTSPVNLDLNGTERITLAANRTFEDSLGMWIPVGSATITKDGTQKHAGSYSAKVVTSGAYSGMQLPYANFTALTQDTYGIYEKYTKELWVYLESADTVQVVIGDKSIKRNIAATTWTKFVFNFQITVNTINQNIQILFKTTGKTNYIDDVSLTKAWDILLNCFFLVTNTGNCNIVGNSWTNSSASLWYEYATNRVYGEAKDVNSVVKHPSLYLTAQTNWSFASYRIDNTYKATLFLNGISNEVSISPTCGKINISGYSIGKGAPGYLSGQIGEIQIVRFTDISQSNVNASTLTSAYKLGIPRTWIGGGAQVVAHYQFRGSTNPQMLKDISNTGNDLTGTNVTTADQVRGTYPSK